MLLSNILEFFMIMPLPNQNWIERVVYFILAFGLFAFFLWIGEKTNKNDNRQ